MALSVFRDADRGVCFVAGASCMSPIFFTRLAAEMFAGHFNRVDGAALATCEPAVQERTASEYEAFVFRWFGQRPDDLNPDIPAALVTRLADEFADDEGNLPWQDYEDLLDAVGRDRANPLSTLRHLARGGEIPCNHPAKVVEFPSAATLRAAA